MDLIYTDAAHRDQGVILAFELDMEFGKDTKNDFEFCIDKADHCCEAGSLLYVEGTEYGGIVDQITVGSVDDELKYQGRTWHGVLDSKVLQPPAGEDYLILYGDAHDVLRYLISFMELTDLFAVAEMPSGIEIAGYQMERYITGYSGILKMLNDVQAKLHMRWQRDRIILSATEQIDYSQDEEFSTDTTINMVITKNFTLCNHLICLGKGDLNQRAVIHLFTDENGGLQPYAFTDTPLQDSDYILDARNQVITGCEEVTAVYDYSSAEITENYILLESQPSDWHTSFSDYYVQDDSGEFTVVEAESQTVYTLLPAQPADWATQYANYFTASGGNYSSVQGVESESYKKLSKKPKDWNKNYANYFYYWSDGITSEYKSAESLTKDVYKMQTMRPSNWVSGYGEYFMKNSKGKYVSVEAVGAPAWEKNKYYKKVKNSYELLKSKPFDWNKRFKNYYMKSGGSYKEVTGVRAPEWKAKKYYTKTNKSVAPAWKNNFYYSKKVTTVAPVWKSGVFYAENTVQIIPAWQSGTYYRQVSDRYAALIAGGIERLTELRSQDKIDVDLDAEKSYDIGDMIGSTEPVTNIFVQQQIIKKIVKLNGDGNLEVYHEVGESI